MPPFGRGYLFHIEQLNAKISSTWHLKSWWSLLNSNYIHYYNQRIISIFLFDMTISDLKIIKYSVCTFSTLKVFPFFWCPRPRKLHNSCHDTPESAQPDKTQIIKIIYLYGIYDADSQWKLWQILSTTLLSNNRLLLKQFKICFNVFSNCCKCCFWLAIKGSDILTVFWSIVVYLFGRCLVWFCTEEARFPSLWPDSQ
jgi:hypothetical protein